MTYLCPCCILPEGRGIPTLLISDLTHRNLYSQYLAVFEMTHPLQASALFPVFAVLEGQTKGSYKGAIDAKMAPLTLWVTESRIDSLRGMVTTLLALLSVPEGASYDTTYINNLKAMAACLVLKDATAHFSGQ